MGGKSGNGNRLEQSESQRLEALAGNYRLIALVQTTRLTGGYDLYRFLLFPWPSWLGSWFALHPVAKIGGFVTVKENK